MRVYLLPSLGTHTGHIVVALLELSLLPRDHYRHPGGDSAPPPAWSVTPPFSKSPVKTGPLVRNDGGSRFQSKNSESLKPRRTLGLYSNLPLSLGAWLESPFLPILPVLSSTPSSLASFLVCDPQPVPKHPHHHRSSIKSGLFGDVRDLWSTANISVANVSVSDVCEDFDDYETPRAAGKPRRFSQTISMMENLNLNAEEIQKQARLELELRRGRSLERDLTDEDQLEGQCSLAESSSESSVSLMKEMPHQAYWTEQQNRLPIPLMELMENEVLEILSKALITYKTKIGRSHFITKELQSHINELKKRRERRLYCLPE
ncbi:cation channel sperm-associated auxiliary subunit zeta [Acomys russatus]|uniref:cation channel sperm-associated auxiliary subunit zeta n=1 Tax=Acomys russatus TaxID=60746 RepID=UPI0021E34749|nr:cation channel sperm-associated auxiliary subunit zeta [Acomys russatus]